MSMLKVALPADLTVDAELELGTGVGGYLSPSRPPDDVRVLLAYKTWSILLILQVDAARSLVDTGELSLAVIARETGFGDTERMRRAFVRMLGHPLIASRDFQEGFRTLSTAQSPHMVAARLAANVYTAIRQRAAQNRCSSRGTSRQAQDAWRRHGRSTAVGCVRITSSSHGFACTATLCAVFGSLSRRSALARLAPVPVHGD
ncbi:hypothetical protein OKW45_007120 [Paraburkholderia sp. WSM4175]